LKFVSHTLNSPDTSSQSLDRVVPRIYVALPDAGTADVTLSKADSPVERRLVADLLAFYAFDAGSHYTIVANRDLERLGTTPDELHDRALRNLRALKLEVRAHKGDRIIMLTAGGNYEATLILLPEIWESVSQMVSGRIVAAVPARDVLYFTGDADAENLADMRRWTSKALEQVDKPLSRAFIRWTGAHWENYTGYAQ
jgi:uncharacterized protein YtpQ (UPF0354 family)